MAVVQEFGQQVVERLLGLPAPRPELHEGRVHHDPVEPGAQARAALEAVDGPEGREESVLDGVGGVVLVAQHPLRDREHPAAVGPDEFLEGSVLALAKTFEQLALVGRKQRRGHGAQVTMGAAMSSLLRFLGLRSSETAAAEPAETDSVRRIAARLDKLDPQIAKYLAAFSYVLARVAHADLEIDEAETNKMQEIVQEVGRLSEEEAVLVVEIAKSQTRVLGGTENYVVTREFRRVSTPEQRGRLLECLYAVAAADGSISTVEAQEIRSIAEELGLSREEANSLRSRYRDQLSVFQKS